MMQQFDTFADWFDSLKPEEKKFVLQVDSAPEDLLDYEPSFDELDDELPPWEEED